MIESATSLALVFLTGALVWWTCQLAKEAKKRRQESITPLLSVDLFPDNDDGWLLNLVLANVGKGAALNVEFHIESDEEELNRCCVVYLRGTSQPLNFLLPGASMSFCFGAFRDLAGRGKSKTRDGKRVPLDPFTVLVRCEDCNGKKICSRYNIDIRSYRYLVGDRFSVARDQQRDIRKISDTLKNWSKRQSRDMT